MHAHIRCVCVCMGGGGVNLHFTLVQTLNGKGSTM